MTIGAIEWLGLSNPGVKHEVSLEWDELLEWLAELADGVTTREQCRCYSLVTLVDNAAGRKRTNVASVNALCLDFDGGAPPWSALEPYDYVAHTTGRHTPDAPRWRVIVRLAEPLSPDNYRATCQEFWRSLGLTPEDLDRSASEDAARLWFGPVDMSEIRRRATPGGLTVEPVRAAPVEPKPSAGGSEGIDHDWPVDAVAEHVAQVWGDGLRHHMSRALGGYLAKRGWTDDAILGVVGAQESAEPHKRQTYAIAAAERAREGVQAPGWGELVQMFGEVWAGALATLARHPAEPEDWYLSGKPWSEWWARNLPRLESARVEARSTSREAAAGVPPLLVCYGQDWWVRDDRNGGYHPSVRRVNLLMKMNNVGLSTQDDRGKPLTLDYVCNTMGTHALGMTHSFAVGGTSWDAETQRMVIGYEVPVIEPRYDADVAAWLDGLFGEGIGQAHQWLAACAPQHNDRLTACMVLIGEHSVGKSLLFTALARMWGRRSPVGLRDVCVQFNGPSVECPIVLDDEAVFLAECGMTSGDFLNRIQQRDRSVEQKGKEKHMLVGCQRVCITANDADAVRFRNVRGLESLEAGGIRMAWHDAVDTDAARQALTLLMVQGQGALADVDRICGHLAWVWADTELSTSDRFVGAYGAEGAANALRQALGDQYAEVYAALHEAANGVKWGEAIKLDADGMLRVNLTTLHSALVLRHGPSMRLADAQKAVRAVSQRRAVTRVGVSRQCRVWVVDPKSLP